LDMRPFTFLVPAYPGCVVKLSAIAVCLFVTELTERPFELLGSQSERDRDMQVDSQDTAESQDTADSQSKSGLVTYVMWFVSTDEHVFFVSECLLF